MKLFYKFIALMALSATVLAADDIIGTDGNNLLIDAGAKPWQANVAYTTNGLGDVVTLGGVLASTDPIAGLDGNNILTDNDGRKWQATVLYTTDGAGNVIPISASGGGGGISTLNGLTAGTQVFAVGTAGSDFAVSSSSITHTFNLPTASATKRGALSSTDWSTFNSKQAASGLNSNKLLITNSSGVIATSDPIGIGAEGGLNEYLTYIPPADAGDIFPRINVLEMEIDPDGVTTAQTHPTGFASDVHFDRTHSGGDMNQLTGHSHSTSHEGSGTLADLTGVYESLQMGDGTHGGATTQGRLWNGNINVGTGHTAASVTAFNMGVNVNGTVGDFRLWNFGGGFNATGNVYADAWDFNGTIGGNYNGFRRFVNGDVTGSVGMGELGYSGNANYYSGLYVHASGTVATGGSNALIVSTSNMFFNGVPITSINADGPVQMGAAVDLASGLGFSSINNINGITHVASGSPVTGTDTVANSFASLLIAEDDLAVGPIGLGWSAIGYVGQIGIAAGKTVDEVNMAISGASIPAEVAGGTLTTFNLYRGVGLFSAGGTLTVPNVNLIKGDATMCSGATVSCHGVNVLDPLAQNNFAGEANADNGFRLSTSGSKPTCDSAHRGLMWNVEGGTGVADILQVCQKTVLDTYAWVTH